MRRLNVNHRKLFQNLLDKHNLVKKPTKLSSWGAEGDEGSLYFWVLQIQGCFAEFILNEAEGLSMTASIFSSNQLDKQSEVLKW